MKAHNLELIEMIVKRLSLEVADRLKPEWKDQKLRRAVEYTVRDVLTDFFVSDVADELARKGVIRPNFTVDIEQLG